MSGLYTPMRVTARGLVLGAALLVGGVFLREGRRRRADRGAGEVL